ncbi:hypothetical protein J2M53_07995 [Arthrobacter sp. zg-ZUI100]|uniref:Uncharacterized protein n=1 Tax=Arthrobacter jiangjiafuii TaxID=2817475 RepID=A0A975M2S5_9MICC|nr:hypothetical protein [Arthrobacter jiangjiafuii]MBP3036192.1 hypothetical protein [Arthrobacter jiangjiafuii]MBP3043304.1 hypothetical protein [Arthrobacter jiangjiafuii]QWC08847.1 hypothetical protein KKR91_09845 [Arthrobacter jiangjiafuii]
MSTIMMYHRDGKGVLHFREAMYDEESAEFMITQGPVGFMANGSTVAGIDAEAAEKKFAAFAAKSAELGYAEIPAEEQYWVVAQYALKSAEGSERDRYLEYKARTALESYFAWRGLGTVEESEFVPGKLNIFCLVPDVPKAVKGMLVVLREANLDFTKLGIGSAPFADPTAWKRRHPLPAKKPFVLG